MGGVTAPKVVSSAMPFEAAIVLISVICDFPIRIIHDVGATNGSVISVCLIWKLTVFARGQLLQISEWPILILDIGMTISNRSLLEIFCCATGAF